MFSFLHQFSPFLFYQFRILFYTEENLTRHDESIMSTWYMSVLFILRKTYVIYFLQISPR